MNCKNKQFLFVLMCIVFMCSCNTKKDSQKYTEVSSGSPEKVVTTEKPVLLPLGHPNFNSSDMDSQKPMLPPGHPDVGEMSMGAQESMLPPGQAGGMNLEAQDSQTQQLLLSSVSQIPLSWKTPQGWQEIEGSGMRLVTFKVEKKNPIECSIVSLGGMPGSLEANISRWLNQIQLDVTDAQLAEFIQKKEMIKSSGNLQISIFDFTHLQEGLDDNIPSMIAAIIEVQGATIYVKMTGGKSAVSKNFAPFKQLCQSLHINQ